MGKPKKDPMDRTKEVWENGKLLIVRTKERYPISSEALMNGGFYLIMLNMAFGLLPITVSGSRIKYFKCSVSQLYATVFGICNVILSLSFAIKQVTTQLGEDELTGTGRILMVLVKLAHIFGFILLMIRGHWVAKRFPGLWSSVAKLLQKAVIDVYGKRYKPLKDVRCFCFSAVGIYIGLMFGNYGLSYFTDTAYFLEEMFEETGSRPSALMKIFVIVGYRLWELCNLSHILVSIFLCFLVRCITVSFNSINEQLKEMVERCEAVSCAHHLENGNMHLKLSKSDEKLILDKLDNFRQCYALGKEVTAALSCAWGISIILEVIVGVINLLGHFYQILSVVYNGLNWAFFDGILQATVMGHIHFLFLFKLACYATEMVEETKMPLSILNMAACRQWPDHIHNKVHMFKMDVANTSITLTASNYFEVNKFLIASIIGTITTYLIVLLQFAQTESKEHI